MFDLNFIAEPGIQTESSEASWSFLHKRKEPEPETAPESTSTKPNRAKLSWKYYAVGVIAIIILAGIGIFNQPKPTVSPDMVLNQVIDLIVESGYMKDLQLADAYFESDNVRVTISAGELSSLHNFTRGYRKEDKIPYEIFRRNETNYVSLKFPWEGDKNGGDIKALKSLAAKTVFSNKININFTDNEFELHGRSTDIISYLLQLADNGLIQKFTLSVHHLESGRFYLKVLAKKA